MYSHSRFARLLLIVTLMNFLSCNKADDTSSLTLSSSDDAEVDLSTCKMRRIYTYYGGTTTLSVTGLFTYNSKGNPFSLVFDNPGTGNPNYYFFWNANGTLRSLGHNASESGMTHQRHNYKYNSVGVCIQDSVTYIEGDTIINVSTFVYDPGGRIVKETIRNLKNAGAPLMPVRNPTFTYDARGNLAVAGWRSSWYDTKINPLRQNKILQFIHRNWSRNNAQVEPKYNSRGLPLVMTSGNDVFFNADHAWKIIYDCQ